MNDRDLRSYNILKRFKIVSCVNAMLLFKDGGIKSVNDNIKNRGKTKEEQAELKINKKLDFNFGINIVVENIDIYFQIKKIIEKNKYKYNYYIINGKHSNEYEAITPKELLLYFQNRTFIYISKKKINTSKFYYCKNIIFNKKFEVNFNNIFNSIDCIKFLNNYESKNNITVKTSTFYDYDGSNYYSGGAERYLVDLHEVCKELGINLDIYQNSKKPFLRKFRGINVIGIPSDKLFLKYTFSFINSQMEKYIYLTAGKTVLNIYSAFQECYPYHYGPSIGISHGISWDNPANVDLDAISFWLGKKIYIDSANLCDKLVSVDTNTANWFQTVDFKLGNQKVKVIPNYVDCKEFFPSKEVKCNKKIVITYPRRLYEPRGMYLLLDIVDDLFKKYKNLEIRFVGKGFDEDIININKKISKYPNKIKCYSMIPERMNEVYKESDISLIPTIYSEGTSLSCLEAMATGNIVIATRIGGLTDLIINGLNGYLIEPTRESLFEQICNIIDNFDKQNKIRKNAIETAHVFNKNNWKLKWKKEIQSFKIKQKSKNIPLVEFYVKDINNISKKMFDTIFSVIQSNKLVYIRSKSKLTEDNISGGLIQLIDYDDEITNEAEIVYIENGLNVKRNEKKVII